jgi:hypothetical protein
MARPVRVDVEGGWYHVTSRDRPAPEWLVTGELLERGGGRKVYREYVQRHVTRGDSPEGYEDFGGRVALGSREFMEKVKGWVGRVTKE